MKPEFRRVLELLTERGVRFVVVGGIAMVLQGSAHMTDDLDVSYSREPENLEAVAEAFSSQHPTLRGAPDDLPFRWDARTLKMGSNFTLSTDLGDIDLL